MSLSAMLEELGLEASADSLREIPAAPGHEVKLLHAAAAAFEGMCAAAQEDGQCILAVSGWRSVARQERIWSRKFHEAFEAMGESQSALCRVMEYSAPPGWSRHHWGCDIDLVSASLKDGVQLEEQDWAEGGACHALSLWLEEHALSYGFIKPYDRQRRGFKPEPWHWSFAPTALPLHKTMARLDWGPILARENFPGADLLAAQAERLFRDFVIDINPALH